MCSRGLGEQTLLSTPGTSPPSPRGPLWAEWGHVLDPNSSEPTPSRVGTHTYWLTA